MADGAFDKLWDAIKDVLPAGLKTPFGTGILLLTAAGGAILYFLGLDWKDILLTWQFLLALAILFLYWAVTTLLKSRTLTWPRYVSWIVASGLLLGCAFVAYRTLERSRYKYNKYGFFESRSWRRGMEADTSVWEWSMEAATDLSKGRVIVQLDAVAGCSKADFDSFYPAKNENTHQPRIRDISSLQRPNSVWGIDDLKDGDEVRFLLAGPDQEGSEICVKPSVHTEGGK